MCPGHFRRRNNRLSGEPYDGSRERIIGNGARLTLAADTNNTFAGNISGGGARCYNGNGDLSLAGNNSGLTGSLAVDAGTVTLLSSNAIGSPTIGVTIGGILDSSGNNVAINMLWGNGIITDDSATPGTTQLSVEGGSFFGAALTTGRCGTWP